MNLYLKVIAFLAILIATFGFAGPYLISAAATELVLGGIGVIVFVAIPLLWITGHSIYKDVVALINQNSQGVSK